MIEGPSGMNAEDEAVFTVEPAQGYQIVSAMVNDELTEPMNTADETETDGAEKVAVQYSIASAQDDVTVVVALEKEETRMPAAVYTAETEDAIITVSAPEGAFSEEVRLQAEKITQPEALEAVADQVEDALDETQLLVALAAYDLTFYAVNSGEEVEPDSGVSVNISLKAPLTETLSEVAQESEVQVVHVPDDAAAEVVASAQNAKTTEITFETESFSTYVITMTTKAAAGYNDNVYATLQAAINAAAQANDANPVIELQTDVAESVTVPKAKFAQLTIHLNEKTWTTNGASAITVGSGSLKIENGTMEAADVYRLITANEADVSVTNVTFLGGYNIDNEETILINSNRKSAGGMVLVVNGNLTVDACTFDGAAKGMVSDVVYGGAVAMISDDADQTLAFSLTNSTFRGNLAQYGGAAALIIDGQAAGRTIDLTVENCEFADNRYLSNGGALYATINNANSNPTFNVTINGGQFANNKPLANRGNGGALSIQGQTNADASLKIAGTTITGSQALSSYGAAISAEKIPVTLTNVKINDNMTSGNGTVYVTESSLVVKDSEFKQNSASSGGAIYLNKPTADCLFQNTLFDGNQSTATSKFATNGGGAVLINAIPNNRNLQFENITAINNSAKYNGGALSLNASGANEIHVEISGRIENNTAENNGGGIYLNKIKTTTLADVIITGNTANKTFQGVGGGLFLAPVSGAVLNLNDGTRIYKNFTPHDTMVNSQAGAVGASSEILAANTASAKATINIAESALKTETEDAIYTLNLYTQKNLKDLYQGYYSLVEVPKRIYLAADETFHTGENDQVTRTLAEAAQAAQDQGLNKIYVCTTVTVTAADEEILNQRGLTLVRCSEHHDSSLLEIKGEVTLDGAHLDGASIESRNSLISVGSNAKLNITGTTLIENGVADYGGGIIVNQGLLNMTGGTIRGNHATKLGGGVYVQGYKAVVNFDGGTIIGNHSAVYGGGVNVSDKGTVNFGLYDGRTLVTQNTSVSEGGGICYEYSSQGKIYLATFTDNESTANSMYVSGGAISIQQNASVEMKNLYASGNRSTSGYAHYGALYTCPTGETAIFEINGALIIDNKDKNNYRTTDIYHNSGRDGNRVYVSDVAPGGGEITFVRSSNPDEVLDRSAYQYTSNSFSMISQASEQTRQWAKEAAEAHGVVVTGNRGGGPGFAIANNGHLQIGSDTEALQVIKTWTDANGKPLKEHPDQVLVYLMRDGVSIDETTRKDASVILSEDNNWNYIWTNLEPGHDWTIVEAGIDGYSAIISEKVKADAPFNGEFEVENFYQVKLDNRKDAQVKNYTLSVGKTVIEPQPSDAVFEFTVKLGPTKNKLSYYITSADGQKGKLKPVYDSENLTIVLKGGEQFTLTGLTQGTEYSIEEAKGDYLVYIDEVFTEDRTASGVVMNKAIEIAYTNIAKVNLAIEKQLQRYSETYKGATFVFEITGTPEDENNPAGAYNNIVALTFNSAGSETVEINDLPYGLNYTVKEIYSGSVYDAAGADTFQLPVSLWSASADQMPEGVTLMSDENGRRLGLKVTAVNDFNENQNSSSGVINKYAVDNGKIEVTPVYEKAE